MTLLHYVEKFNDIKTTKKKVIWMDPDFCPTLYIEIKFKINSTHIDCLELYMINYSAQNNYKYEKQNNLFLMSESNNNFGYF